MVKAVDKHTRITDIRVTAKSGGRSGDWRGGAGAVGRHVQPDPTQATDGQLTRVSSGRGRFVMTCSTRAAAGVYPDRGGELVVTTLRGWGFEVADPTVVPDGPTVAEALRSGLGASPTCCSPPGGPG